MIVEIDSQLSEKLRGTEGGIHEEEDDDTGRDREVEKDVTEVDFNVLKKYISEFVVPQQHVPKECGRVGSYLTL